MTPPAGSETSNLAAVFGRAASTFGGMGNFIFFGERLVALARLHPGDSVLDAATGRGAVAFHAAQQVGCNGRVLGIDIAEGMLQETAKALEGGQWPMIELRRMDAQALDLPDASFDAVLCGFALWFFLEPSRALAAFHRVLRPHGTLALSTIAHDSPYHRLLQDTLRPHIQDAAKVGAGVSPKFDTARTLEDALRAAGFTDIRITTADYEAVAPDAESMWHHLWSTSHRRHLEGMSPATLDAVKADYFSQLEPFTRDDGIHLVWRALLAVCTRDA